MLTRRKNQNIEHLRIGFSSKKNPIVEEIHDNYLREDKEVFIKYLNGTYRVPMKWNYYHEHDGKWYPVSNRFCYSKVFSLNSIHFHYLDNNGEWKHLKRCSSEESSKFVSCRLYIDNQPIYLDNISVYEITTDELRDDLVHHLIKK